MVLNSSTFYCFSFLLFLGSKLSANFPSQSSVYYVELYVRSVISGDLISS